VTKVAGEGIDNGMDAAIEVAEDIVGADVDEVV